MLLAAGCWRFVPVFTVAPLALAAADCELRVDGLTDRQRGCYNHSANRTSGAFQLSLEIDTARRSATPTSVTMCVRVCSLFDALDLRLGLGRGRGCGRGRSIAASRLSISISYNAIIANNCR